jgi:hypothetical protein
MYLERFAPFANAFLYKKNRPANLDPHHQRNDEQQRPNKKQAYEGNDSIEDGFEEHLCYFTGQKYEKSSFGPT